MKGKRCRLYDEDIVRNIMISTGLAILEHVKKNKDLDVEDICEFVDLNAEGIIENTIEDLNEEEQAPPGTLPADDTTQFPAM